MVPSSLPPQLKDLTQCEEMLIARSFPVMLVYTRPGAGYLSYKGHVITLPHNVQKVTSVLPNMVEDLPIVRLQCKGAPEKSRDFTVRRNKVLDALSWLVENNKAYRDVVIDHQRINNLPVEGNVETTVLQLDCSDDAIRIDTGPGNDDESEKADVVTNSFVPTSLQQPNEEERLNETIKNCEMEVNSEEPFNEFRTPYLATMSFPTLFPDCEGDPFFTGTMREVAKSDSESFALKLKHLIKFAEKEGETWSYRFAAHPRFGFWAYNILMRRRVLQQGAYYIKQHPSDAALDLDDLKGVLANDSYKVLMNKIMYYSKNISGTSSYWNQQRNNLRATLSQVDSPTIFWTLSCAEFHWPEFHSLLNESDIFTLNSCDTRNNIVNNQHLFDWFFTERTKLFVKHWLYNTLKADWHWFRYEFAVNRGSIHCHGLARLKSDPGLCKLSKDATNGFLARQKIAKEVLTESEKNSLCVVSEKGLVAEKEICKYHDFLMTCENPIVPGDWVKPVKQIALIF